MLSAAVLKDLEANVEEAVVSRSWLDATAVLPPALSAGTCMYDASGWFQGAFKGIGTEAAIT